MILILSKESGEKTKCCSFVMFVSKELKRERKNEWKVGAYFPNSFYFSELVHQFQFVFMQDSLDNITLFSLITIMSFILLAPAAIFIEGVKFTPSFLQSTVSKLREQKWYLDTLHFLSFESKRYFPPKSFQPHILWDHNFFLLFKHTFSKKSFSLIKISHKRSLIFQVTLSFFRKQVTYFHLWSIYLV